VVHDILIPNGALECGKVVQVSANHMYPTSGKVRRLCGGSGERRDLDGATLERFDQVTADEAGGAGHQGPHILRS
jgi:hypothetical protein